LETPICIRDGKPVGNGNIVKGMLSAIHRYVSRCAFAGRLRALYWGSL